MASGSSRFLSVALMNLFLCVLSNPCPSGHSCINNERIQEFLDKSSLEMRWMVLDVTPWRAAIFSKLSGYSRTFSGLLGQSRHERAKFTYPREDQKASFSLEEYRIYAINQLLLQLYEKDQGSNYFRKDEAM